jgi:hypothetical protein
MRTNDTEDAEGTKRGRRRSVRAGSQPHRLRKRKGCEETGLLIRSLEVLVQRKEQEERCDLAEEQVCDLCVFQSVLQAAEREGKRDAHCRGLTLLLRRGRCRPSGRSGGAGLSGHIGSWRWSERAREVAEMKRRKREDEKVPLLVPRQAACSSSSPCCVEVRALRTGVTSRRRRRGAGKTAHRRREGSERGGKEGEGVGEWSEGGGSLGPLTLMR